MSRRLMPRHVVTCIVVLHYLVTGMRRLLLLTLFDSIDDIVTVPRWRSRVAASRLIGYCLTGVLFIVLTIDSDLFCHC